VNEIMESLEVDHAVQINLDAELKRKAVKQAHEEFIRKSTQERKERLAEQQVKVKAEQTKKELEEKQNFFWENERQRFIRHRLMQIGDSITNINNSRSYVENKEERLDALVNEYRELKTEYLNIPCNVGKETFKLVLTFENVNGDRKLESRDAGQTWRLFEYYNGSMSPSGRKVIVKDSLPVQITGSFTTEYTKRFFPEFSIPTVTEIELLDADAPMPKTKKNSKAEPLRFTWYCPICKEPNAWNATECKHCHIKRKN
jgi:hypothetical protein